MNDLRAPFPWFGGKSAVAADVWQRFGDVGNYIEPFFGSGACLLARPNPKGFETINDFDGLLANAWRALQADPDRKIKQLNRRRASNIKPKRDWMIEALYGRAA